jgi:hypothetical protein
MVFRFFKDKAPAPDTAKSPNALTTTDTTVGDTNVAKATTTAKVVDWEAASKSPVANPQLAPVEQDPEDDDGTKLEKATAATKALTDFAQMASMRATAEDVIAAYKIFLGRLPESAQVVQQRMGPPVATLLIDFLASDEFLMHPERAKLILGLAKRVQEQQAAANPTNATTATTGTTASTATTTTPSTPNPSAQS